MIPISIVNKVQTSVPYIADAFGGVNNLLVYAKEVLDIPLESSKRAISTSKYQELIEYFYTILSYKRNILMISPWAMYIDLRDKLVDDLTINSINPDAPYQVYDMKGNLKYTVIGHLGIFGESRLDENLVNKSLNGSLYFLKYKTFSGDEKVKLIIVNMFSREIRTSNRNFQSPVLSVNSTITIVKKSNTSNTSVYFIEGTPLPPSSIDINNFRRPGNEKILTFDNPINYSITQGGWLLIDNQVETVSRSEITNANNDILIEVANNGTFVLYYVGLNVDVSTLNKYYNTTLTYSNKPITETITLNEFIL